MTISSPWPSQAPYPKRQLTDCLREPAERQPDGTALIGPDERFYSFGEVWDAALRMARVLQEEVGVRKGEVVAIFADNCPEYVVAVHSILLAGGVVTTVNPRFRERELVHQLSDCGAVAVFCMPGNCPLVGMVKDELPALRSTLPILDIWDKAAEADGYAEPVAIDPEKDLAFLPYSSGTTGLPKGVMLTHHNLVANLCQCLGMQNFDGFTEQDTILAVLPYFHIYGMVVIMMFGLCQGATVVSMPRFDMQEFLGIVQKYRVTVAPIVPPIVLGMVKHPAVSQFDLSSLRLIFSGAAPLGEEIARALSKRLGCPVVQGYGMTEASPVTHLSPTRNAPVKPGSIGMVVPSTEVKLVDVVTGAELGKKQEGELLIRGPQIMKGYLGRPEDTAQAIDTEGWYHSGDVGYVDDEGWFYIVDRTKELIKYKGMQVAPAELEALLATHPAVLDAAVIRKADEEAGEVPKAFVVLKPDAAARATTAEALMAWVAERVAPHKRVRHVEFIDQIPKSASGKILRRMLVEREKAAG